MTIRIALVGAGLAARSHALDIITDPTMELTGVTARSAASARAFTAIFGGTIYPDVEAIVDDDRVNAVVVAVPPSAVLGVTEQLDINKPCLVEKPIVTTDSERDRLSNLAQRFTHLIAPFNRRYQPHIRQAANMIESGLIGNVVDVNAQWRGPYRSRFANDGGTYRGSAGPRHGVLVDTGSHALDLISMLVGYTHPIHVLGGLTCNDRGADIAAELEIAAGTTIRLTVTDDPNAPECGGWAVVVNGAAGSLTVDSRGSQVRTTSSGTLQGFRAEPMHRPVSDLARMADGIAPLGSPMAEVLTVSDVIIAAHDHNQQRRARWKRPRGKALGRLNGAC
ncbi:Gfo/Idh/MocA family oxidoreductase [Nocardia ninae]|uniref:Oxidoreductase n=1 Tax=Nocardia ninae NBRC 108245 TaxID=1210091 RepID=A0A511MEF4_9NOCA|nr:Gfo/Idh/MocA family oxidoreductase [Nocardia ninae]GEM38226.1 hypothetical protein NN4_27450 [Nocardia ninae NBRC 108245]